MNYYIARIKVALRAGVILAALTLVSACDNGIPEPNIIPVTINGQVKITAGPMPSGQFHFRVYVLESLDGDLSHPLEEIEDFTSDTAAFSHTFDYPAHMGEGLALHVWLDTDDDGIFCTPTARLDPGGLATMQDSPAGEVDLDVTLSANCRSAHWFYPAAN